MVKHVKLLNIGVMYTIWVKNAFKTPITIKRPLCGKVHDDLGPVC